MIITNDKYFMSEEITNMYSAWMQLVIRKLQLKDFGGYKCISKNSLGDAESGIRLYGEFSLHYSFKSIQSMRGYQFKFYL